MSIRIYNSLTHTKEDFIPLIADQVRMYVCGPTVYDDPHIGHLRSAFVFDVIRRHLTASYKVQFVRNVTDVDDKIIQRAQADNKPINEITQTYLKAYHVSLEALGIVPPDAEPCATDPASMQQMIVMIQDLIKKDMAYANAGNVYFRVRAFDAYGALSHQNIDQMQETVKAEEGQGKAEVLDFALWKASKEGEPAWDSPWGLGRPGWHIECSAMSTTLLGNTFDIHGGGRDLIFPHHENERAQSMAATGETFAKIWMHHGLVTSDGKKMSKSLNHFTKLDDFLAKHSADVLKLFFLQSHYSQDCDFTWEKMQAFQEAIKSFEFFFNKALSGIESDGQSFANEDKQTADFERQMNDDFNTPKALAVLFGVLREGNQNLNRDDKAEAARQAAWLLAKGQHLGLFQNLRTGQAEWLGLDELIQLRHTFREAKNYTASDFIRDELARLGFVIEDHAGRSEMVLAPTTDRSNVQIALTQALNKAKGM